jgi:phospholipid/cholesterol/gamma-HCH transport system ATP-binding protein
MTAQGIAASPSPAPIAAQLAAQPAVEVEGLVAYHGSRRILDQINLSIHRGEILIIMGGSGAGKSTFLRHLLGLNRPSAGSIRIFGSELTQAKGELLQKLRRQMGVAFQGGALFSSLTVGENVKLPLREHTKLDEQTMAIMARMKLDVVNLGGFEHLMPAQLSGGMVKRAALARAIVMDPRLLFFDEPSAGLDPVVSAELDELIMTLNSSMGITIVVVTHELESAFKIAHRICVLDAGRILMVGTVDEVRNSTNERIQDLLNRRPRNQEVEPDEYLRWLADGVGMARR